MNLGNEFCEKRIISIYTVYHFLCDVCGVFIVFTLQIQTIILISNFNSFVTV